MEIFCARDRFPLAGYRDSDRIGLSRPPGRKASPELRPQRAVQFRASADRGGTARKNQPSPNLSGCQASRRCECPWMRADIDTRERARRRRERSRVKREEPQNLGTVLLSYASPVLPI